MSEHHYILAGPQRSGKTTALEVLTRCDMDTGFTIQDFITPSNEFFEYPLWGEHYARELPYILKHARLASHLEDRVERFDWKIDHVCIFVRDAEDSIQSTVDLNRGPDFKQVERRFYNKLGKLFYQCIARGYPYSVVEYTKFFLDWTYAKEALGPMAIHIPEHVFEKAWVETLERIELNGTRLPGRYEC